MAEQEHDRQRAVYCIVRGKVQGVGYRAWASRRGKQLGLSGTVQNLPDGSVEVKAAGPSDRVAGFIQDLHSGPAASSVVSVETVPTEGVHGTDFVIIR